MNKTRFMKILTSGLFFPLAIMSLTGCFGARTVQGTGVLETFTYTVDEFRYVKIAGSFEVVYEQGDTHSVTVQMQENLYRHVDVNTRGSTLEIRSRRRVHIGGTQSPIITITAPEITEMDFSGAVTLNDSDTFEGESLSITLSGAGDIDIHTELESLEVSISGAGSLTLAGNADSANLNLSGAGSIDGLELWTREADVRISGAGSGSISCIELLTINISGAGSFSYRGDPEVSSNISGVGTLNRID